MAMEIRKNIKLNKMCSLDFTRAVLEIGSNIKKEKCSLDYTRAALKIRTNII